MTLTDVNSIGKLIVICTCTISNTCTTWIKISVKIIIKDVRKLIEQSKVMYAIIIIIMVKK